MTNEQKRRALLAEVEELKKAFNAPMDTLANDEALSDEDCDAETAKAIAEYDAAMWPKWWKAFALQFPKRGGWFGETFAPSFGVCESKRLSAKQTDVFRRYCIGDSDTWTTGKYYARIENRLIILSIPKYSNGIGYLTVKSI